MKNKIDDEILVVLYNDGLKFKEIQTVFNCTRSPIVAHVIKLGLSREKPKSDFTARYGKDLGKHINVSQMKGTVLKKCLNPDCNYYYYGQSRDRYCCKKCAIHTRNLKSREYRRKWIKEHREHLRKYNKQLREQKKKSVAEAIS